MNPANSAGFVAHVTQIKASHMAHTFLVADELEYGKVLQYVKDDDAKNLVDEALTTGAILEVRGTVEMLPDREAEVPKPG